MAPLRLPPNPFDRWARSESGLHLPSWMVPRASRRTHHVEKNGCSKCCCDEICTIPQCWGVTLSGFSDDSCTNCEAYNKAWYLPRVGETTAWSCTIPDECTECGDKTITLTISEDDDEITLSFNGVTWSKSVIVTEATYCESHTLSYVSNSGDCNHDESSVTITSGYNADGVCPCPIGCGTDCGDPESFYPGTTPGLVYVDLTGITDNTCTYCDEDLASIYALTQNAPCLWCSGGISNRCSVQQFAVELVVSYTGNLTFTVRLGTKEFAGNCVNVHYAQWSGFIASSGLPVDGTNLGPLVLTRYGTLSSVCTWPLTATISV